MKKVLTILFLVLLTTNSKAETKFSTLDYIDMWKVTAVVQMNKHKIPASITLAQGILESGNGNSRLAKYANNHFGIKCHNTWDGNTFFADDDKKNECFRSYESAGESYRDHSLFLQKKRYAGLFQLKITDYKGWAKGLKSAGYATNPKYAHLLIGLIEKYDLTKYDRMPNLPQEDANENLQITPPKPVLSSTNSSPNNDEIVYNFNKHTKQINSNKATFVIAASGDTYYKLSKELEITLAQLYKYNEFNKKDVLKIGDIVYVAPLKGRAAKNNKEIVLNKSMSLREIAHQEGIKLKKVLKYNSATDANKKLPKGTKVILR